MIPGVEWPNRNIRDLRPAATDAPTHWLPSDHDRKHTSMPMAEGARTRVLANQPTRDDFPDPHRDPGPAILQIVNPDHLTDLFFVHGVVGMIVAGDIDCHAGKVVVRRGDEVKPVPRHICSLTRFGWEVGVQDADSDGLCQL